MQRGRNRLGAWLWILDIVVVVGCACMQRLPAAAAGDRTHAACHPAVTEVSARRWLGWPVQEALRL